VANYKTGGGLGKVFLLANIFSQKKPGQQIEIIVNGESVFVKDPAEYCFQSTKRLKKQISIDRTRGYQGI
jgi:hypothetical protein